MTEESSGPSGSATPPPEPPPKKLLDDLAKRVDDTRDGVLEGRIEADEHRRRLEEKLEKLEDDAEARKDKELGTVLTIVGGAGLSIGGIAAAASVSAGFAIGGAALSPLLFGLWLLRPR